VYIDLHVSNNRRTCGVQIERVERFVSTVDAALRQRDNQHQLVSLATARIESYDAIDAPNDECVKVRRSSLSFGPGLIIGYLG